MEYAVLVVALLTLAVAIETRVRIAGFSRGVKAGATGPKPHRHQWRPNSREETNKQQRVIHVCRVEGCRDTYVEVLALSGSPVEEGTA